MAAFSIRWHGLLRIHSKSSQPGPRAWRSAASADNAPNTALSSAFSSPPNDGHSLGSASEAAATCRPASRPPPALRPLLLLRAAVSWLTAAAHARSCRLLAMSELPAARPGQRGGRRGSMRRMHPDPGPQRRPGQRPGAMLRLVAVCCAAADQRVRGRGQPRSAALSASHERVWERQRARRNELQTAARVRRLEQWAAPGCAAPRRRSTAQQRAQTEHALPVGVRCVPAPPPRLELCWAAAGGGAQPAVWWTPPPWQLGSCCSRPWRSAQPCPYSSLPLRLRLPLLPSSSLSSGRHPLAAGLVVLPVLLGAGKAAAPAGGRAPGQTTPGMQQSGTPAQPPSTAVERQAHACNWLKSWITHSQLSLLLGRLSCAHADAHIQGGAPCTPLSRPPLRPAPPPPPPPALAHPSLQPSKGGIPHALPQPRPAQKGHILFFFSSGLSPGRTS